MTQNFLSNDYFSKFRDLIYNHSGIHFSDTNRTILESRLKERLRVSGIEHLAEYYSLILKNEGELKILLDSVTTNLTRFFRNTSHFRTFENYVIPDLVNSKRASGNNKIKLWSAGCSTGEEPYSLAISLKEILPPDFQIEITASDLSLKSLLTAKEGFYPDTRIGGVPEKHLKKYFEITGNGVRIRDEIKSLIKFDYHNLKFDSGLKDQDVIFCRNVIIYFDEQAQQNVINKFYDVLNNHSYLFIGHSESLFGMNTKFEFLKTDWACIYSKIRD